MKKDKSLTFSTNAPLFLRQCRRRNRIFSAVSFLTITWSGEFGRIDVDGKIVRDILT